MARSTSISSLLATQLVLFSLLSSSAIISSTEQDDQERQESFAKTLNKNQFGLKEEKLSHFRLYWHDTITGSNPSAIQILPPIFNATRAGFGLVRMIDNPLTQGPELSSKLLGKAQGFYASASQTDLGLLMVMNFAFVEGKYNGSTITVLGRNAVLSKVREMAVIGGSGLFRFARGYVEARTQWFDRSTGDAIVEYNVYVLHY